MNVEARFVEAVDDTDYRPSEDEPFMCERQKDYFRKKCFLSVKTVQ